MSSPRSQLGMASTLSYRRLATPLHATRAGVGALWVGALGVAALVDYHPLLLIVSILTVLAAGAAAGVGRELLRSLRTAAIVALPIVIVNVLVSRDGLTVFARLGDLGPFGQGNLTVEALVYGCVIGMRVTILILLSTLASLAIDPDELLRGLRRLSFRSALTASLAVRMLPLLAGDAQRLAEAQQSRPSSPDGKAGRLVALRARGLILGATVGSSLDRAMDVAATLELRGFAGARRAPRRPRPWSRHDVAFLSSAVAILALTCLARFGGLVRFSAYPLLHMPVGPGTLLVCIATIAATLAPFLERRGVQR